MQGEDGRGHRTKKCQLISVTGFGAADVVLLNVVARTVETLDVKEGPVQEFELPSWVVRSLGQAYEESISKLTDIGL